MTPRAFAVLIQDSTARIDSGSIGLLREDGIKIAAAGLDNS
jgi:hypothetical protein